MYISIISSTDKAELEYDVYGNCYLICNNKIYNITIGKNNNPELLQVYQDRLTDLETIENTYVTGKIFSNISSLRGFAEDKLIKMEEGDSDGDEDREFEFDYFPEQRYFYTQGGDVDNIEVMNNSDIDPLFRFYGDSLKKTKYGYPYNSLYSILVIEGNTKSKKIVFYSEEYNDTCSYRLTLYTDGYIKCNVIGTEEKMYKILQLNGELLIE
jgi:hypothetical protein